MLSPTNSYQRQQVAAMLVFIMMPLLLPCVLGLTHRLEIKDKEAFGQVPIGSEVAITCVAKVTPEKGGQLEYEASVSFIKNKLGTSYSDYVVSINTTKGMEWTSTLTVSNVTAEHKGYYACRGQFPIDNTTHGLMHDIVYLGVEEEDHLDWDQVMDLYREYIYNILVKKVKSRPSVELKVVVAADTWCIQTDNCTISRDYLFKEPLWTSNLQYENKKFFISMAELSGLHLEVNAFNRTDNTSKIVQLVVKVEKTDVSGPTPVLITAPDQVEVNQKFSAVCTRSGDDESRTLSMSFTQDYVKTICPEDGIDIDYHETHYQYQFKAHSEHPFSIFARLQSLLSGEIKCSPSEISTISASKDICVQNNISFYVEGPRIVMDGDEFEIKCTGPTCTGAMGKTPINWVRQNLAGLHEHGNGQCAYRNMATLKMNKADNTSSRVYDCTMGQGNNMIIKSINVTVVPSDRHPSVGPSNPWDSLQVVIAMSTIIGIGLLISLAILTVLLIRSRREESELKKALYSKEENAERINEDGALHEQAHLLPFDRKWEFPRNQLKLGKQLGIGNFGVVYQGVAQNIVRNEASTVVAVKMAHRNSNTEVVLSMVKELKIMSHVSGHINIVNLLGAVVDKLSKRELMIIVEYCPFGNLLKYLTDHKYRYQRSVGDKSEDEKELEEKPVSPHSYFNVKDEDEMVFDETTLVGWSYQIANGMSWLSQRKVLHGDLAARNILLSLHNIVKISDFGLSSNLSYATIYEKNGSSPLPIPWMAIESLQNLQFSTQSDVWSYGIVLWEIFTLGKRPYVGIDVPDELTRRLLEGYRLEKPEIAPEEMHDLMTICWKHEPLLRPTFDQIKDMVADYMERIDSEEAEHHPDTQTFPSDLKYTPYGRLLKEHKLFKASENVTEMLKLPAEQETTPRYGKLLKARAVTVTDQKEQETKPKYGKLLKIWGVTATEEENTTYGKINKLSENEPVYMLPKGNKYSNLVNLPRSGIQETHL